MEISRIIEGRGITISAKYIGEDLNILCCGGDRAHIGAVSLATSCHRGHKTQASVSTITVLAHRDDELSCVLAERFCKALGCTVLVACGIHYDQISPEQIQTVVKETLCMGGEILQGLMGYQLDKE